MQIGILRAAIRNALSPRIERLILHVTTRCPLDCAHCFVDKTAPSDNELTVSEAQAIARTVNPLTWLDIGGGEPFLRDDLLEICLPFDTVETGIPTNGWLVEKTLAMAGTLHRALGERLTIAVSVDGFRQTHDRLRGTGSFDRAMETLEGLLGIDGLRVSALSTVSKLNYQELPDLAERLRDMGLFSHGVNILRGSPADPDLALPDPEAMEAFGRRLMRAIDPRDYKWSGPAGWLISRLHHRYVRKRMALALRTLARREQLLPCLAGRVDLVICANGDVAPCELRPTVGNIRSAPLKAILSGPAMASALGQIRAKECYCTHECNMLDSTLLNPRGFLQVMLTEN